MFRELLTLFGNLTRLKALAYILKRPGESGTASECAAVIGVPREAALKELTALSRLGIVGSRRTASHKVFVSNTSHPLAAPLSTLLFEATTPTDRDILQALKGVRGLVLVVASGILTGESRSSVDLLLVCRNPETARLARSVKRLEALAAVPLRFTVFEVDEYLGRKQAYDRLLRDIFEYRHRIVLERRS